jgi:hypothetical protein
MDRFDGTAARQLRLIDEQDDQSPVQRPLEGHRPKPAQMRMLKKDIYAELARRRRRAQIAARHLLDNDR